MKQLIASLIATALAIGLVLGETQQSCDSPIYCQGDLLDVVQTAGIFDDSKTFVDLIQINSSNVTLRNFEQLINKTNNNPTKEDVRQFVEDNFVSEGELDNWTPEDFTSSPQFLKNIEDIVVRDFARNLVSIWPNLGRKVKEAVGKNPDKHSLISLPNGFIIPGGRFKEIYYWDSYWIVKGLLISEMRETVKGILENFLYMVKQYGFIPNGSRVYYLNRSQPPLLALMVGLYMDDLEDLDWLAQNIETLEAELQWWLENRMTVVEKNRVKYQLAHYASQSGTPRPESYSEDIKTCAIFIGEKKEECYKNLKSGAESGWDFSSRWIFDSEGGFKSNLTDIQASRVAPVELNVYLCKAFKELSRFYSRLGQDSKSLLWLERAMSLQKSIELVMYDREDGIWYDYDISLSKNRKYFYPSNFAPLWANTYESHLKTQYGAKAAKYFRDQGLMKFLGGIPTSLEQSNEQWDLPNAWPPLVEIVVLGLQNTEDPEALKIASTFATRWINSNIIGYNEKQEMFEKYDAVEPGKSGDGGEYTVQSGFGWTNGVALSIINEFYTTRTSGGSKKKTQIFYGL